MEKASFILIDDNDIDNKVNVSLLKAVEEGTDYLEFSSCCQGLDYIKAHLDDLTSRRIILLLDIQMPDIDGFGCLEKYLELPQSFQDICTIFILSSTIDEYDIKRAKDNPLVKAILEKPLDVFLLRKYLQNAED